MQPPLRLPINITLNTNPRPRYISTKSMSVIWFYSRSLRPMDQSLHPRRTDIRFSLLCAQRCHSITERGAGKWRVIALL